MVIWGSVELREVIPKQPRQFRMRRHDAAVSHGTVLHQQRRFASHAMAYGHPCT
jgi:hypothetical protein